MWQAATRVMKRTLISVGVCRCVTRLVRASTNPFPLALSSTTTVFSLTATLIRAAHKSLSNGGFFCTYRKGIYLDRCRHQCRPLYHQGQDRRRQDQRAWSKPHDGLLRRARYASGVSSFDISNEALQVILSILPSTSNAISGYTTYATTILFDLLQQLLGSGERSRIVFARVIVTLSIYLSVDTIPQRTPHTFTGSIISARS